MLSLAMSSLSVRLIVTPSVSPLFVEITLVIGYEPAELTMHPPPQNDRGWVHFFRIGV